jgi:hypothetical protein
VQSSNTTAISPGVHCDRYGLPPPIQLVPVGDGNVPTAAPSRHRLEYLAPVPITVDGTPWNSIWADPVCGQTPVFPPHWQPQSSHFGGIRSGVPRHGTSGWQELLLDESELDESLLEESELLESDESLLEESELLESEDESELLESDESELLESEDESELLESDESELEESELLESEDELELLESDESELEESELLESEDESELLESDESELEESELLESEESLLNESELETLLEESDDESLLDESELEEIESGTLDSLGLTSPNSLQ